MSDNQEKDSATNADENIVFGNMKETQSLKERLLEMFTGPLAGLWIFFILGLGIVQAVAGYLGIQDGVGTGWAVAAIIVYFMFRFTLPITVGAFFGAMNVWEWHPILAFLFAAPGLLFMIPGLLVVIIQSLKSKRY